MTSTLTDRIAQAAAEGVEHRRTEIENDTRSLKGIVLELSVGSARHVDATLYLERRLRVANRLAP